MITKEELAKMTREEVGNLLRKKQMSCKTCAEEVEMYYADQEYIMIKERLLELHKERI